MSFTKDELDSFNAILDQRLSQHRRELERLLDQRINALTREFGQRLTSLQQELLRNVPQSLTDQQSRMRDILVKRIDSQQVGVTQTLSREIELAHQQQQQQFESSVERALAAQLLAFEQLINQRVALSRSVEQAPVYTDEQPEYSAIEVQTEISWEDLVGVIGNALNERLAMLDESIQALIKDTEQSLVAQIEVLRTELARYQAGQADRKLTNVEDASKHIENLERIIDSLHMAMTANHTLLSNSLYYHQHAPLERAHPPTQISDETVIQPETAQEQPEMQQTE